MSTMGTIMKEQIIEEKKTNPEKFYTDEEIIKNKTNKEELFALGVLSKALENIIPEIVINTINEDTRDKKDNNLSKKKVKRIEDNYIQMESLGVKRRSANLFVRTEKGLEIQEDEESSSFKK